MSEDIAQIITFAQPSKLPIAETVGARSGLTAEEIRIAYRLFLGREPESDSLVEAWRSRNFAELRRSFLNSPEFREQHPEIFAPSRFLPLYMQDNAEWRISRLEAHPRVKHHALEIALFGYTVIRGGFPQDYCRALIARFKSFEAANPRVFAPVRQEFGRLPRIVNLHLALRELIPLFTQNTLLLAVQDLLFGRPTSLYTSLFYEQGSQQPAHRDTPVFCTRPEYLYFGNTVYLEAANDDNGCLEVIEGGHTVGELDREKMAIARYGSLDDVPPLDNDIWLEYQETVATRCDALNLPRRKLFMDPGDAVIWHPQLPHGGSPIRDQSRTRYSLVFHSTPVDVPVYHQDVFFRPSEPAPETPAWAYFTVDGRAIADHCNGIAFGEPANQEYPFDSLNMLRLP